MKKLWKALGCIGLATAMSLGTVGCFGEQEPETHTIQYTTDQGVQQLEVTKGKTYSLTAIPEKTGYTFMGLFDAEVGGTQFVTAAGSSLVPFNEKNDLVLFPQYQAKQYTVVLDYQGAAVTGDRQVAVSYGQTIPELPKNVTLEHKTFSGWYTQEGGKGIKVADAYGVVPVVSVVNESNFTLNDNGYIYLYAGFNVEQIEVTFHFGEGIKSEEITVDYGTPIEKAVPQTRNSAGKRTFIIKLNGILNSRKPRIQLNICRIRKGRNGKA